MAKRGNDELDDLYLGDDAGSDPFLDLDGGADTFDDVADDVTAPVRGGSPVGAIIQVIGVALIGTLVFLAIGAGIVFAGRAAGVLDAPAGTGSVAVLSAPATSAPAQPTAPPDDGASVAQNPTPVPPTAIPTEAPCTAPGEWWTNQQNNYAYFIDQAIPEAQAENNIPALLVRWDARRGQVANFAGEPCVEPARAALLRLIDSTSEAARAIQASNTEQLAQQQANIAQANADLTVALWELNIDAGESSPISAGVARDSGASCGAADWYAQIKPQRDAFFNTASTIDIINNPPSAVRSSLDTLDVVISNISRITAPECAAVPLQLLNQSLTSYVTYLNELGAGNTTAADSAYAAYQTADALFMAWLNWLGITP